MKRFALIALGLLALSVAAIAIAPSFVNWDSYKTKGAETLKTLTGYDIQIDGPLSMALLPSPSLKLGNASARPPGLDDAVLSLDGATVKIKLLPLFSGRIVVESVALDSPRLNLIVLADGRQSWMTPELEKLLKGQKPAGQKESSSLSGSIVLDSVHIKNGSFNYKNLQDGSTRTLSRIDSALRAESLDGPYAAEGTIVFQEIPLAFDLSAGRKDGEALPVELSLISEDHEINLDFSGVTGTGPAFMAQGTLALSAKNPAKAIERISGTAPAIPALAEAAGLKGMITASPQQIAFKDGELVLGATKFQAKAEITNLEKQPPALSAELTATDIVNFEKFVPPQSSATKTEEDHQGAFLPEAFALPENYPEGQIKIFIPESTWRKQNVRNIAIAFARRESGLAATFKVGEAPGKASAEGESWLGYQSRDKSAGKTPAELTLAVGLKGQSQYLADTLKFIMGDQSVPPLPFKTSRFETHFSVSPRSIALDSLDMTLDQSVLSGKGLYKRQRPSHRDSARMTLAADWFDIDSTLSALHAGGPPQQPSAVKSTHPVAGALRSVQSFALPFDIAFDLSAQKARYEGQNINGLSCQGNFQGSTLVLDSCGASQILGASFGMTGKVSNLAALDGIDLQIRGSAQDPEALLTGLKLDTSALPRPFGAANLVTTLKGSAAALNFAIDLSALRGSAQASGILQGLPEAPSANTLDIKLSHPSFADLLNLMNPGMAKRSAEIAGPLNARAKVVRDQAHYKIQGLEATLGSTAVSGDLSIQTSGPRPAIAGTLQTGTIPLDAWMGTSSAPEKPTGSGDMRWSRKAIDTAWMRAADLDLQIVANGLRYGGWDLRKPSFSLALKDGVMTVPPFTAGLFNGKVTLGGTMASGLTASKPLSIQGKSLVENVALAPIIKAFTGALPLDADGNVSMTLEARATGISMAALIFDLGGTGKLNGKDVTLKGFDLARFGNALSEETKPGDTLNGLWKGAIRGGQTRFDTVDGTFKIQEGIANIEYLTFDGPQARIDTTGAVNLPQWRIDLKNRITLRQATKTGNEPPPPFDIAISGPLDNPAQTFGQGLLEDYFQRKLNRKIEGVIQDKLGKKLPPALQGLLGTGKASDRAPEQEQPAAGESATPPETPSRKQEAKPEDLIRLFNNLAR